MATAKSVVFAAIVKNEAHCIIPCIDSTLGVIDRYCVVDTGSTDGTQTLIADHFAKHGIPGQVIQSDWKGFGESRSELERHADATGADYILMMDADHRLVVKDWSDLTADLYEVAHHYNEMRYTLPILQSTRVKWRYEMPVHEWLAGDRPHNKDLLHGAYVVITTEGARSKDKDKFLKDAALLEPYCAAHPDDPRPFYYWAQSLRDHAITAADPSYFSKAEAVFLQRARMTNGWDQETFMAYYEAARCRAMVLDDDTIVSAYLRAHDFRPTRHEPLVMLARYFRSKRQFASAYMVAKRATELPPPQDILFVDMPAATWAPWDELAVACWQMGHWAEGRAAAIKALAIGVPPSELDRCRANLTFFEGKKAA